MNTALQHFSNWTGKWMPQLRALGPYVLIEVVMPGGTLIALGLWAYRNRTSLLARWHAKVCPSC